MLHVSSTRIVCQSIACLTYRYWITWCIHQWPDNINDRIRPALEINGLEQWE